MQYAIETLEIEVHRVKGILRQIDANCHIAMSNIPAYDIYINKLQVLQQAIERLKSIKELAEQQPTAEVQNGKRI